jgi:zinc protease
MTRGQRLSRRLAVVAAAALAAGAVASCDGSGAGKSGASGGSGETVKFDVAGIPVILKPIAANEVVAVRLYIKGGSAALTPSTQGIEHFIGDLSTHGTEKYSKDQFSALSTSTGTTIGAAADFDYTVMSAQAVRENWEQAWDLFTQAVLHPAFPAGEVVTVRQQIANQLRQRLDDPDTHLALLADSAFYAGHPYARDPLGTPEVIAGLSRDSLVAWHTRRLTKENLVFVVVGNVSRDDLTAKITAAFGALPASGGAPAALPPVGERTPSLTTVKQALPTNYIVGFFSAPGPTDSDFAALRVATLVLSDRLFEEVRTKRNLTYAVDAGMASRKANRGLLYVTAVEPDTTFKVMLAEVKRLQEEPVPADRLQQTINGFVTQYWVSQETNMGQGAQLGLWEIAGGGWQNALKMVERVHAVTAADVQRVATKYLRNARFVVIGNPAKVDRALFTSME